MWVDQELPTDVVLSRWRPGSFNPPWTWDDEEHDICTRLCGCCVEVVNGLHVGEEGHYQAKLESFIADQGFPAPVLLGNDGRVWDGHHRVIAARRLGLPRIPVQVFVP